MPRYRLAILVQGVEWFPIDAESPEAARAQAKAYAAEAGTDFIADVVGEVRVGDTIWQQTGTDDAGRPVWEIVDAETPPSP